MDDVGMVIVVVSSRSGGDVVGRYIGSGCLCVAHLISPVKQCYCVARFTVM